MINPHKYPFQKRLHELKGLPPISGAIIGLQDQALESGDSVLAIPANSHMSESDASEEPLAVSWYMPAPQHVLEVIHAIAAASQDRWSQPSSLQLTK